MAYKFKKQFFGFMDMLRFAGMVPRRREIFANAPATPLPTTYKVNITAKALHPGKQFVKIAAIDAHADDLKTFKFVADGVKTKKLATFRSGQYITITANVGDSRVTRAYTLASSPLDALEKGFYTVTIKGVGILSDYMCAQTKVGDVLEISEPSGDFCYEPLRDRKHIVAVAGGVGITSLLSMAKSVYEGTEDCTMTFFYCVASKHELLFTDELDAMNGDKIKVVYVVEKGDAEGCEKGLMSADLVKKYVDKPFTLFMCGSDGMYEFVKKELAPFNLRIKDVHTSPNGIQDRKVEKKATYNLTVVMRENKYTVPCRNDETLLVAMERAGIHAPSKCRAGGCGFCRSKLVSGEYTAAPNRDKRRIADFKFGWVHPCCIYPDSDITIEVPQG